jgi:hypothetical protein
MTKVKRVDRRADMPTPYKRAAYLLAALFLAIHIFLESVGLSPVWLQKCKEVIRSVELSGSGANAPDLRSQK